MQPSYVDVSGTRTRYLEAGTGEPLVLVHGGSYGSYWSADDWEHNIAGLARRFRVLAPDKIGCGFTDNPADDDGYVIGTMVDHIRDFIRTLGLGRVHLAGHSRGGYAVTRLALDNPELVDTLTIVDSSSLVTAPNPQYLAWEDEAARIANPRERYRYLITVNSWSDAHITDQYLDVIGRIMALPKTAEAQARLEAGGRERFNRDLVARQAEVHDRIRAGGLTCPTLVVWAYEDPSATMTRCGIPSMDLVLPFVETAEMHILNHAGHEVMRERPEAFNAVVLDFIERHRRNA
jgi:pimeloyl-ACP methyl ester carboxylesterase